MRKTRTRIGVRQQCRNQELLSEKRSRPGIYEIAKEILQLFDWQVNTLQRARIEGLAEAEGKEYLNRRKRLVDLRMELEKFTSQPS